MTSISRAATAKRGLEPRERCRECGETLEAVEKNGIPIGWHCASPSCGASKPKSSRRSQCSVCEKIVTGLMVPCLQCGHVTCFACTEGWFGGGSKGTAGALDDSDNQDADDQENEKTCPSGCGCRCLAHERISVPHPKEMNSELEAHDPDSISSNTSTRSERLMSVHAPDSAIAALFSLTRTRSISTAKDSVMGKRPMNDSVAIDDSESSGGRGGNDIDSWAQYMGPGRGI
jgi:hypothetical protein